MFVDVIRAWKDVEYRSQLTVEQLAALPASPAGTIELSAAEMSSAAGGASTYTYGGTCPRTDSGCRSRYSQRPCCF